MTVGQVRQYLEEHGYTCIDATVNFIPLIPGKFFLFLLIHFIIVNAVTSPGFIIRVTHKR